MKTGRTVRTGMHPSPPFAAAWKQNSKYNRVDRALPFPDRGAKGCKWVATTTAKGRKLWLPVA